MYGGFINFKEYFKQCGVNEENKEIQESVINKIKHLFYIQKPERVVQEFKKIFNITDDIKISKVEIGGGYNLGTKEITYSTINSLIHELIHYLQNRYKSTEEHYKFPKLDDEGILLYMLQPLELNNIALSFADDAIQFGSLDGFMRSGKKSKDFNTANRDEKLKHLIFLLHSDVSYSNHTKDHKKKLLKLIKEYYYIIKSLQNDVEKYLVEGKIIIDFI